MRLIDHWWGIGLIILATAIGIEMLIQAVTYATTFILLGGHLV